MTPPASGRRLLAFGLRALLAVERPFVRRVGQAVAEHVADVIDDDGGRSVRLRPQASADLLAEQRETLCRAQQDCATDRGRVEALADDLAGRQHADVAGAQLVHQVVPLIRRHGAVDRCGRDACIAEPLRDVLGVRDRDAERDRRAPGQVLQVVLDDVAGDAVLIERLLQVAGVEVAADAADAATDRCAVLGAR